MIKEKGQQLDMSDLRADPLLYYQDKYYKIVMPVVCFVVPTVIPVYFWGESFENACFVNFFRYCFSLNVIFLINSFAHRWGYKPYDKSGPGCEVQSLSVLALGEGWHNYHHTFPRDYRTSELGKYGMNLTTTFIEFFGKIGWAYDLKTMSNEMISNRVEKMWDGSPENWGIKTKTARTVTKINHQTKNLTAVQDYNK